MNSTKEAQLFEGISASPGIAIGKAYVLSGDVVKVEQCDLKTSEIEKEISKFQKAIEKTKDELKRIHRKASIKIGEDGEKLFNVYKMLLEDSLIIDETIERISKERKNADYIYNCVLAKFQNLLESADDEYFMGRVADIRDVKRRVIRNIQGKKESFINSIAEKSIIFARELTPLETVQLNKRLVLAFVTDLGGKTSHAAIMARSLQIPAVVGLRDLSNEIKTGNRVIVDGKAGEVIINPSANTLEKYRKKQEKYINFTKRFEQIRDLPCRTRDGKDIELSANLEFPDEIETVKTYGAKGIGLYRSEYLYLMKNVLPSEDELYSEYNRIAKHVKPNPVIIRTLDIGGDKQPRCINIPQEENPFLGLRAIRLCLERKDIFKTQLRAILRASAQGNIKILIPMICCVDEIMETKKVIADIQNELKNEKIPFDENIDIGVMIEVPSAAILADLIAKEVDFLSIGTNDLIQYTLAVDRGNEHISYLYKNLPLSVLRIIRDVVDAGHRQGVWVGMCGEMAGSPIATLILLGLGLDELSVSPAVLPEIKTIIRSVTFEEAEKLAEKVLQLSSSKSVENFIFKIMKKNYSEFL
ncbi:phosphoenolpyruvate--protein phosphotransferase [candidate division KSB1 bacterium]|nr:phosphoenolpyruvate--protein phosphotransferase [candidate division KSB1 bacterium]